MLGAIIGDIVGSYYEVLEIEARKKYEDKKRPFKDRIKVLNPETELFTKDCSYTDDSVLTIAIANAIISSDSYEESLRKFGLKEMNLGQDKYGRSRFGNGFVKWLNNENEGISYGNGGAMRISPVGFYYDELSQVIIESKLATEPSHNNEEAILGAQAVSICIYLSKKGYSKERIKEIISFYFEYDLDMNLEQLQKEYTFSARTSESVPQAIFCFLESNSFEDALRKSLSIGGDSDTIAAIVGAISEAFYGIPEEFKEKALSYLPPEYKSIINQFYQEIKLLNGLKVVEINDQDFINYIRPRTKRYDSKKWSSWAAFPITDTSGILKNIKVLVPEIIDEKTLLINIHEFTHAYELYNQLGKKYNDDVEKSEQLATSNERKYLEKKKLYQQ